MCRRPGTEHHGGEGIEAVAHPSAWDSAPVARASMAHLAESLGERVEGDWVERRAGQVHQGPSGELPCEPERRGTRRGPIGLAGERLEDVEPGLPGLRGAGGEPLRCE